MELDDFFEPEVAIAVGLTALVTSAPARRAMRRAATRGLAWLLEAKEGLARAAAGAVPPAAAEAAVKAAGEAL